MKEERKDQDIITIASVDEEDREPSNAELWEMVKQQKAQIDVLVNALSQQQARQQPGQLPQQPPVESGVNKLCREANEKYTAEQLARCEKWVIKHMGGRLEVQKGPRDPATGEPALEVVYRHYTVTQEHRDKGWTNLPDDWKVWDNVPVYALARYYPHIILDMESYANDTEKLFAMIAESEERKCHGPFFEQMFDKNGALKPIQRRAARRQIPKRQGKRQ